MKRISRLRKKIAVCMVLCLMTVSGILAGAAGRGGSVVCAADVLEGSGTAEDPYVIRDSEDLWQFAEIVEDSPTNDECARVADGVKEIDTTVRGDQTDQKWSPIGTDMYFYKGSFDGNGARIYLCVETSKQYAGLFGRASGNAVIRNVTTAGSVSGREDVGGICGQLWGGASLVDCNNEAVITGSTHVGGIAGYVYNGEITGTGDVCNTGGIKATSGNVGGLVGFASDLTISVKGGLKNTGEIESVSGETGGLFGYVTSGTIEADGDIENAGKVTDTGSSSSGSVGGLVGHVEGNVTVKSNNGKLYNAGAVSCQYMYVGGIIGQYSAYDTYTLQAAEGIINDGTVSGTGCVGGICGAFGGKTPMTVKNGIICNYGRVTGNGNNVGGVAGKLTVPAECARYANLGAVENAGDYTGGVFGYWTDKKGSLKQVYNCGTVTATNQSAVYTGSIVGKFEGVDITGAYYTTAYPVIGNQADDRWTISGAVTNCFYPEGNTAAWKGETAVSAEAFASGEVAYLLDGDGEDRSETLMWGQEIGVDQTPVLAGMTVYRDGSIYTNTAGHAYGDPEYTWDDTALSCTAVRTCGAKGCTQKETETVAAVCEQEVQAGCLTKGTKTYRATFTNPAFAVQSRIVETAATGHDITGVTFAKDEKSHWKTCKHGCGIRLEEAAHTWKQVIDREATETTVGSSHEECSVCGYQKTAVVIPATGSDKTEQTTSDDTKQTTSDDTKQVKKGQVLKNQKDGASYVVTKTSGKYPEVTYQAPKNKKQKNIVIPDTITVDGVVYRVTSIKKDAFKNNTKLVSVTIGRYVTTIGKNAFANCRRLKKITIRSAKLTKKSLGKSIWKNISKKAVIKAPKKKLKEYQKLFQQKGLRKTVKFKAI